MSSIGLSPILMLLGIVSCLVNLSSNVWNPPVIVCSMIMLSIEFNRKKCKIVRIS